MKTPKIDPKILIAVRDALADDCEGMCNAADEAECNRVISTEEREAFASYINLNLISKRKRFFTNDDSRTTDNEWFVWPMNDVTPRFNWLDKHIKLNS